MFEGKGAKFNIFIRYVEFFWPINAFKWEHIVGTPPFYSGLGTPLFKMTGSATEISGESLLSISIINCL